MWSRKRVVSVLSAEKGSRLRSEGLAGRMSYEIKVGFWSFSSPVPYKDRSSVRVYPVSDPKVSVLALYGLTRVKWSSL